MTHIPGGALGVGPVAEFTAQTSGNNPLNVWHDGPAQAFPDGSTYRALVSAIETTFGSFVDFRHFVVVGTFMTDFNPADLVTSTEIGAGGSGGMAAATAIFVDNGGSPALELTGIGGKDISWRIKIESLHTIAPK